ncbi:diguanylate cyclase/phosphodiesterase [Leptothrix cholodnii SP-6]|uniref:Diguanylate cyclase/phosphodiesterase n=1 Tax=Leptothrix cholodnii (strain ATCC 51168 / LMG 8142 / SP-6) TaxID=395495 RepID=B1Y3Y1_LEPCP|nr:EAL domain-containing protein [Leptothrix cholodnii]ACB33375.1 diguanylate cyclase/phosphodiesterase [Leptothrix cholodnii SP-6]
MPNTPSFAAHVVFLIRRVPIAARLVAAFGLVLLLLGLMLAQALGHTATMNDAVHRITQGTLNQVMLAHRTQTAAHVGVEQLYSLFVLDQRELRVPVYAQIDQAARDQQEAFDALLAETGLGRNEPVIARVLQDRARYVEAFDETVSLVELDPALARPVMVSQTMPALRSMLAALDMLVAHSSRRAGDDLASLHDLHGQVRARLWFVGVLAVLVALASAALITHSIAKPLRSAVTLAGHISAGRIDTPLPPAASDEVGVLTQAMDDMRQNLARREARIAELAYRDDLTGLANRTLFNDRLDQALASARRQGNALSVLVLDLDRFKQVNDVLGHTLGDQVLKEVGERLRNALMRTTDTVARLAGDEFAVLLPTQDHAAATALGRRLLSVLESPVPVQGQRVDVSASIGIACADDAGLSAAQLMARADIAMHEAKQGNRGLLVFEAAMERHVEHGLTLLSDLRRAADQHEFFLLYQPKLRLSDGHCDAAEVLIRWRHPQRGIVPPDRFIPFAEQTGAIKAITLWVLQHALNQLASWQQLGWQLSLNINVSTRDLGQPDFPALVDNALRRAGVAAASLCLEVTESAIMDDPAQALRCLQALNEMGVRLSIDDFGTGYSSLAYLKKLPVQELKIDRSFVSGLDRDEADVTIVRSTIDLAHHMGLAVVAEGIETEAVSQRLRSFGCDQAQGYLYSRPLPAMEFIAWLKQHRFPAGSGIGAKPDGRAGMPAGPLIAA